MATAPHPAPPNPWTQYRVGRDPIAELVEANDRTLALALAAVRSAARMQRTGDGTARDLSACIRLRCREELERQGRWPDRRELKRLNDILDVFYRHDERGHLNYWMGLVQRFCGQIKGEGGK